MGEFLNGQGSNSQAAMQNDARAQPQMGNATGVPQQQGGLSSLLSSLSSGSGTTGATGTSGSAQTGSLAQLLAGLQSSGALAGIMQLLSGGATSPMAGAGTQGQALPSQLMNGTAPASGTANPGPGGGVKSLPWGPTGNPTGGAPTAQGYNGMGQGFNGGMSQVGGASSSVPTTFGNDL